MSDESINAMLMHLIMSNFDWRGVIFKYKLTPLDYAKFHGDPRVADALAAFDTSERLQRRVHAALQADAAAEMLSTAANDSKNNHEYRLASAALARLVPHMGPADSRKPPRKQSKPAEPPPEPPEPPDSPTPPTPPDPSVTSDPSAPPHTSIHPARVPSTAPT